MLSPFETYDLLFVRDTINNLNYDNEILNESIHDLKSAFMFLYEKHKELQRKYDHEKNNHLLLNNYRRRIAEMAEQHEVTHKENLKLRLKVKSMVEIIQAAVTEQFYSMSESELLI